MNWFRENRALGIFALAGGISLLLALYFVWSARAAFARQSERLNEATAEWNRLQRLDVFPNDANLRMVETQAKEYGAALENLKGELAARTLPVTPLAPNEFQGRLREAVTRVATKARAARVTLPDNFFLGFDEYASALPGAAAAPLLGQQLEQVELLAGLMIEAGISGLTTFERGKLPEEGGAAPTPTPTPGPRRGPAPATAGVKMVESSTVRASFAASPTALRRVINSIAGASRQFYIVRTLHVLNEKEAGPAREAAPVETPEAAPEAAATPASVAGLTFIVGTEKLAADVAIEIPRFNF